MELVLFYNENYYCAAYLYLKWHPYNRACVFPMKIKINELNISVALHSKFHRFFEVYLRKLTLDKYTPTLTAVTLLYSWIILKKLTENKSSSRKLEKSVKFSVKVKIITALYICI